MGILDKRQIFRRKLGKIAENCDQYIDPWDDHVKATCLEGQQKLTANERIADEVRQALADRVVVDYVTLRVLAARSC
jgi:hypothetical protein